MKFKSKICLFFRRTSSIRDFAFKTFTTIDGFLTDYVITPANIDDRNVVWDLCEKYNSISIIVDKEYVNKRLTP